MRKITFLLALGLLFSFPTFAQLEKGYWIGKIQGGLSTELQWQNVVINFQPEAMKLVARNLAVGLQFDYEYFKFISLHGQNLDMSALVQKYFGNKPFKPFIGLSTGAGMGIAKNTSSGSTSTTDIVFLLNSTIGISWWLNENACIDLSAGYGIRDKVDSFDGIKLGVGFKFGKP
jgi:hypothetical protein